MNFEKSIKNISKCLINIRHNKTTLLTIKEFESWKSSDLYYFRNEKFDHKNKFYKSKIPLLFLGEFRGAVHSIYDWRYSIPRKVLKILLNESNYNFCFRIKHSTTEFENTVASLKFFVKTPKNTKIFCRVKKAKQKLIKKKKIKRQSSVIYKIYW